jgi:murein DD-endopeptidase MepM/ murein hydrolase activator NlpD
LIAKEGEADMPPGGTGVTDGGDKPALLERVWAWLHRTFPERQIYVRSDGRVQFFTFGPSLQATLAGLALILLGWVAFATVNVVFKDHIIAAKDNRYQQMQSAYENRLSDLQISYDELNGALVNAQDKFKATADALTAKQNAISGFLNRKGQLESTVTAHNAGSDGGASLPPGSQPAPLSFGNGAAADSVGFAGPAPLDTDDNADGSLAVMPAPALPQPRVEKPAKASMLDLKAMWSRLGKLAALHRSVPQPRIDIAVGASMPDVKAWWNGIAKFASALTEHKATPSPVQIRAAYAEHPMLKALDAQTARLSALSGGEATLMAQTETVLDNDVGLLRAAVKRAGINPDQFLHRVQSVEGVGGPEISLDDVQIAGSTDRNFDTAYLRAGAVLDELDTMSSDMGHIPLAVPVTGAEFDRSSGFGARVDPFTHHFAFHPGVDFAGPWGSPVSATAPGTVVFAGNRGGYGNMVEIDHGFGIHTRYGHLSRITVGLGSRVGKGSVVGRMGSTGRSTGPHVHYEIWYDNVVRNPSSFIEAGRHVF